jgi:DNA-binding GntR family transcriptional regulator
MHGIRLGRMQNGQQNENASLRVHQFHADLARRIVDVIREREYPAGSRLKEQLLADELCVSRSPVRAALRLLDRYGVVRTVPNQGCFLVPDSAELDTESWDLPPTSEELLYARLTRDRFASRLDLQINVTELTRRYGASRSQLERVLARLADEGLAEREPSRGWRFLPALDEPRVYYESYQFRLATEPLALLTDGFQVDPRQLEELRRRHHDLMADMQEGVDPRRIADLDAAFHETLGAWSNNRFILQAIQQQVRLRRLMELLYSVADPERMFQSCGEHLAILDALEAGDREAAADLIRKHIEVSRDLVPDFESKKN